MYAEYQWNMLLLCYVMIYIVTDLLHQVHQSELAFRLLTRQNNCQLAYTQMIPANKYAVSHKFRDQVCDWQTNVPCDRPLIVQVNGHDVASLVATGKLLAGTVDGIDLNLGIVTSIHV